MLGSFFAPRHPAASAILPREVEKPRLLCAPLAAALHQRYPFAMTTTLQQMLAEPKALLDLARNGEEVVLTDGGEPVLKVIPIASPKQKPSPEALSAWLDQIAEHAAAASTGKKPKMTEQKFWDDMRADRC